MYQFSRAIFRELSNVLPPAEEPEATLARQRLLATCESMVERLALTWPYVGRPVRRLFYEIRHLFPIGAQLTVYRSCETHLGQALAYLESQWRDGIAPDGGPASCLASSRRGSPCRRRPAPESHYCPSHKHLEPTPEEMARVGGQM